VLTGETIVCLDGGFGHVTNIYL